MKQWQPTTALLIGIMASSTVMAIDPATDWPAFRGRNAQGVADGFPVRTSWNADPDAGELNGILWQTAVPGLGHSSPVIRGDRIFIATALANDGEPTLQVGRGGRPDAADDHGRQQWIILCYDKRTGEELWRRIAHQGLPRATRHAKATHANTSVAIEEDKVVAFFGSEGLYCYDLEGNLQWSRDLGVIDISKYGIGWGYASSPAVAKGRIALVCDDPQNPFIAVLRLADGEELWRVSRKDICERSWATPLIHESRDGMQVVVNGWPWIVAYDLATGDEEWRIRGGGDNPVPTPFTAHGSIYITNSHGGQSPILVVRPEARGNLSASETDENDSIVWSTTRGGAYMSTPVVYGDFLYLGTSSGVIRCFDALTGEKRYEKRLGSDASMIASLVAAEEKIYCTCENGTVFVLAAGPEFKILSRNQMGQPCFATPAISEGSLYFRTTTSLVAIEPGTRTTEH